MHDLALASPILTLFLIAAVGQFFGRVQLAGFRLGVAGVLFAGLAAGMVDPGLALPPIVLDLGLALFVYSLGIAAGPTLSETVRTRWRELLLVAGVLLGAAVLTWAGSFWLGLSAIQRAGLFAGGLTNTPALASVVEAAHARGADAPAAVVAYSLAYPGSVLASLLVVAGLRRARAHGAPVEGADAEVELGVVTRAALVRRRTVFAELDPELTRHVLLGRVVHGKLQRVASPDVVLEPGDIVSLIGQTHDLDRVIGLIGERAATELVHDREVLDYRRIFVSNRRLAGQSITSLELAPRFGALVTRVRRGDTELVGHPALVLELGDRVRVLAPPDRLPELSRLFGDSYRSLGELDVLAFSAGLTVGLALGALPIPLPGGSSFTLGQAGGPLIVGLLLGAQARTGTLVWQLPHGAGTTLRQVGLVLFFAAIGSRAGERFAATVTSAAGAGLALSGALLSFAVAAGIGLFAVRVLRLGVAPAGGLVAGALTQPAALAAACEQSGSDAPESTYAAVVPVAMLVKILLAQALLALP